MTPYNRSALQSMRGRLPSALAFPRVKTEMKPLLVTSGEESFQLVALFYKSRFRPVGLVTIPLGQHQVSNEYVVIEHR
jgi:hypothetical protein